MVNWGMTPTTQVGCGWVMLKRDHFTHRDCHTKVMELCEFGSVSDVLRCLGERVEAHCRIASTYIYAQRDGHIQ